MKKRNAAPPPPLDRTAVKAALADLRGLLGEEPAAAGHVLRKLTGLIAVDHERYPHKRRGEVAAVVHAVSARGAD